MLASIRFACCVADVDTAAAYQAYIRYKANAIPLADFQSAQTTARNSLNSAIVGDLSTLTAAPDSAALSAASTVAQQIITEQGIVALPPPGVSLHCSSSVCIQ